MHRTQRRPRRRAALAIGAIVLLLATSACGPELGRPAIRQVPNAPSVFDNADPAVLVDGGTVYLYGSSNNMKLPVRVISSFTGSLADSQQEWARNPVDAMPTRPAWVNPNAWEIWAPSVVKIGATYWAYFAGRRSGATDTNNDQCIGRASASGPVGPFRPEANPIYCGLKKVDAGANAWGHGALDPEVFRAPDGKLYLLAALSRTRDNIGVVPLDSAGRVIGGANATPTTLVSQGRPWHDGTDDGRLGSGAFLENPSMVYDPATKTYLLFYSAGQWYTARYNTGFARCGSPTGPCTVDERAPFLKGGGAGRTGPGGLTAFRDAGGALRVAYASWQSGRENQVGPVGEYKRQTHWAVLRLSNVSEPKAQTVSLG